MERRRKSGPFVRTKLHRPPVPPDLVVRTRLLELLAACGSRPLTLVSAAAGYGKGTLVSSWLATNDCASSWVPLDESDDDLREFLTCLVAAIETVAPAALPKTSAIDPPQQPPYRHPPSRGIWRIPLERGCGPPSTPLW